MTDPQFTLPQSAPQSFPASPRGLSGDDFIAWMLHHDRCAADPLTGRVANARTGRVLRPAPDGDGYATVTLYHSPGAQYTAKVHRIVAIAAWGPAAVADKEVGHRDHNKMNNALDNLWVPESRKEHFEFDGQMVNLQRGQQKCKEHWEPCVRCGDPNGAAYPGRKTPARVSGARYEIEGDVCWRCYHALAERARRARKASKKCAQ